MPRLSKTEILSRKLEFDGWHKLETLVLRPASLRHDGQAEAMSREVYRCGTAVVALLWQPETDSILLNEQFRVGAYVAGDEHPWLYECCAGMVDEGETPEEALHRETKEETGCDILDVEFIGKVYPSPGGSDEIFMIYCGRIGPAATGHYGMEEEGEEIQTHLIPADDVLKMLDDGRITNGATVLALHWFARHRDRLRKKWNG